MQHRNMQSRNTQSPDLDAMILAAGLGTRMREISEHLPKALLPVGAAPLLAWNLDWLRREGVAHAAINLHHHVELLDAWIARWDQAGSPGNPTVTSVRETQVLGTAGGLANARRLLTTDPVLVLNMDQLFRPRLETALAHHREGKFLATLFCTPDALLAQVVCESALSRHGVLCTRVQEILGSPDPSDASLFAFTGVYLLSQEALAELPREGFAELGPYLRRWCEQGRVGAVATEEAPFREIGAPEAWAELARELAHDGGDALARALTGSSEPAESARARGWRTTLASGAQLRVEVDGAESHISLGETELESHRVATAQEARLVAFLAHAWPEAGWQGPTGFPARRIRTVVGDGSRRQLFRAVWGAESRIIVSNPIAPPEGESARIYARVAGGPDENEAFAYVAGFLSHRGVRVPIVHAFDPASGSFLLEDLGRTHLLDRVRKLAQADDRAGIVRLYEEAIETLVRMRTSAGPPFEPQRTGNPEYDAEFVLQFEAGYFHRELVTGWAGLDATFEQLQSTYERLAEAAIAGARLGFIHRDFQSRNLMATRRGLAVIDFQGARLGPAEYDLASLLFDPYARLDARTREELFDGYLGRAKDSMEESATRARFAANGVNRLMQALGAYAYLGGRLGKPGFIEHIPAALHSLEELTRPEHAQQFGLPDVRELHALVTRLQEVWRERGTAPRSS